jgi:hypothetical protein
MGLTIYIERDEVLSEVGSDFLLLLLLFCSLVCFRVLCTKIHQQRGARAALYLSCARDDDSLTRELAHHD